MAQFHSPRIQPYNAFRKIGTPNLVSRYIPNDYYVEFTPSWWRMAVDNAINYSDLTWLDTLYSWCIQSSPFLVSQINKRLVPMAKAQFAFRGSDGQINDELTEKIIQTKWFRKFTRSYLLSKFYGVKVVGIDVVKDELVDYPLRNIDILNKAVRDMTYGIQSVAYVKDYDNLFFMQPETSQDFKLGMMQPISRALIGIVEAYNNWSVTSATYSYPRTAIGYLEGNAQLRKDAEEIALDLNPMSVPLLPFKQSLDKNTNVYAMEIKPLQTQMYPDAFRVFKEYIESYRSEIMQLVTGGTLLGATEKNTNSEQLANIHMGLYEDLCEDDMRDFIHYYNQEGVSLKLANLLGIPELLDHTLVEVPDKTITVDKFERAGRVLSAQGMAFSPSVMTKIGMEAEDINPNMRSNNWGDVRLQNQSITAKIKSLFTPKEKDNGNDSDAGREDE